MADNLKYFMGADDKTPDSDTVKVRKQLRLSSTATEKGSLDPDGFVPLIQRVCQ